MQPKKLFMFAPALTREEFCRFEEDGFLVKRGLIGEDLLRQISQEIDALHERMAHAVPKGVEVTWENLEAGKPRCIKQLMNSEKVSLGIDRMLHSNPVLDIVEAILGPDISLFHSKLLMKAAHDGAITPWHQDY